MFGRKKDKKEKVEKKSVSEKLLNKVEDLYKMSPLVDEILTEMEKEKEEQRFKIEKSKSPVINKDNTPTL